LQPESISCRLTPTQSDAMIFVLRFLLRIYRSLPSFRGKYRLGYAVFKPLLDKPEPVQVVVHNKIKFFLPNSIENLGKEIIVKGEYERETVKAIVAELKKHQRPVFFDVGANVGAIAIPVKKKLPAVRVHAFEASPATFGFLKRNFQANNLSDDRLVNKAIHSTDGVALRFFDSIQYGKSSLAPMYTDAYITVSSVSLDAYCRQANVSKIDLMKVDVQGFEVEVFTGMQSLLKEKKVAAIFFEFEDWAEKAAGFEAGVSQEFLVSMGYDIFDEGGKKLDAVLRQGSCMLWAMPGRQ
jgi:FkbM family methyltransferase